MFNFFDEIKKSVASYKPEQLIGYNLVNIAGKILYVEGHCGLVELGKNVIIFKTKQGKIGVEGEGLSLAELDEQTMKITGEIKKVEVII